MILELFNYFDPFRKNNMMICYYLKIYKNTNLENSLIV